MAVRRHTPKRSPRDIKILANFVVDADAGPPPLRGTDLDEMRRLQAVHDPARRSACRICSRWVGPKGAWREVANWKLCSACEPLLAGGVEACWRDIIADDDMTDDEVGDLTRRLINPAYFLSGTATDPGNDFRWQHLGKHAADEARAVLAAVRRLRAPRPSENGSACTWCGVSVAVGWVSAPWRWPVGHGGRGSQRGLAGFLCGRCAARWERGGRETDPARWRTRLLAEALDLPWALWGEDYGLRAFFEVAESADGTDARWAYLGTDHLAALRWRVVQDHPRYASPRERRVIASTQRTDRSELLDVTAAELVAAISWPGA